jgi:hypothetical protein
MRRAAGPRLVGAESLTARLARVMQAMTAPTAPRPTLTRPAARDEPPEADDDPEMAVTLLSGVLIVVIGQFTGRLGVCRA